MTSALDCFEEGSGLLNLLHCNCHWLVKDIAGPRAPVMVIDNRRKPRMSHFHQKLIHCIVIVITYDIICPRENTKQSCKAMVNWITWTCPWRCDLQSPTTWAWLDSAGASPFIFWLWSWTTSSHDRSSFTPLAISVSLESMYLAASVGFQSGSRSDDDHS